MAARNGKKKDRKAPAASYVPCQVEPGMFRGEYLVSFQAMDLPNSESKVTVRLLVDENEVTSISGLPKRNMPAEGMLRVEVLARGKGLALLVLPQPSQPLGERVYVEEAVLREGVAV